LKWQQFVSAVFFSFVGDADSKTGCFVFSPKPSLQRVDEVLGTAVDASCNDKRSAFERISETNQAIGPLKKI